MSDEAQPPTLADRFRQMADRIDHNKDAGFGGACVIIPPVGVGEPLEMLALDNRADAAQFFSNIVTRLNRMIEDSAAKDALAQGFGRR
jgi:hypothetical protein